ncbi:tRNA (uridine(34)/cytosine(34)/5-carboxymethylaminomethyluridine(34)-2'-O)-methyltransferase TrmL [Sulfuriflexus mobilis]|uniref:tRNA (uridine(34)/cytosine(34)/5- carboxymethylaminomethyluridine(34)-2'-O)- methyltransferase TrmL n=1 Tax=Sulfuriflexus mobilis TaxID=1811807 RepID=UPI000F847B86|nr:tRNA (uridine(34)/cytosine(34)/5-carboxymethylaminomethyluridine(34)-2'-O)-methyltransferase TrmL [Sulfuriflexus mobilis]
MFHIVLFEPEIPPNTGNVMRLCANTGMRLHLIHPLGFDLNEKSVRRAGLDYRDMATVTEHESLEHFIEQIKPRRLLACSTKGTQNYAEINYIEGDALLFGPETRGLPQAVLDSLPKEHCLRVPMQPGSRSLNLSNTVAVIAYEAWRQNHFPGSV